MSDLSKSIPLEEVEALLAAERERCAKVASDQEAYRRYREYRSVGDAIAAAIRSLAPQTIGDEG